MPKPLAPVVAEKPTVPVAEKPLTEEKPVVPAPAVPAAPVVAEVAPEVPAVTPAAPAVASEAPVVAKPAVPPLAIKPGTLKLPPKPVIRKPGMTVASKPLPKPILPKPVTPAPAAPVAEKPPVAPVIEQTAAPVAPVAETVAPIPEAPKPLEQLKSVTQKLKGVTQQIPPQAILRKTGIIAEGAMSEEQKEAAKHKTARISLSDAMGVAPVKDEHAPMKTIRIKRPIDIPNATRPLTPQAKPEGAASVEKTEAVSGDTVVATPAPTSTTTSSSTITQRKTLKIARPGGVVRPAGKFGVKRPSQAATVVHQPVEEGEKKPEAAAEGTVADIPEIADIPAVPNVPAAAPASDGPAWLWTLSALVQAAACVAIGALAWCLYQGTQTLYF